MKCSKNATTNPCDRPAAPRMQLDILAGVKVSGRAQGQVLLNGLPRKQCNFGSVASYVQQKDVLAPSATVGGHCIALAVQRLRHLHSLPRPALR